MAWAFSLSEVVIKHLTMKMDLIILIMDLIILNQIKQKASAEIWGVG